MLKHAWYVTDTDFFTSYQDGKKLGDEHLLGRLAEIFGADAVFGPAHTATATYIAILMAEHLGESITEAVVTHDRGEIERLLAGLNLLGAHLAQTLERLAYHVYKAHIPGIAGRPAIQTAPCLARAGEAAEIVAGHLKEAQLLLSTRPQN